MSRLFDDAIPEYYTISSAVVSATPFTIVCWFRSDQVGSPNTLVSIADSAQTGEAWELNVGDAQANRVGALSRTGGTSTQAVATANASNNTWHMAAGVWRSSTDRSAYLDGANRGNDATSSAATGIDRTRLAARARSTSSPELSGYLAEVAIWNVGLSDAEITDLGNGTSAREIQPGALVFFADLRIDVRDWIAGVTITPTGTPAQDALHPTIVYEPSRFGLRGIGEQQPGDFSGKSTVKVVAVGQATEADAAQAVSVNPIRRLIGQATEADTAQIITPIQSKVVAVNQATETDTAQAVDVEPLRRLVNVAAETDTAQSVTVNPIHRLISQATETDTAQAVDVEPLRRLVNVAAETDTAQAVTVNPIHRLITQAVETDTAQAVDVEPLRRLIGQAVETDEAQAIAPAGAIIVGQATETDVAQAVTWAPKIRVIGQAIETDIAQAVDVEPLRRLITQTTETDAAQVITPSQSKVVAVNQATETDTAQAITWAPKIRILGQTQETDEAQSLGVPNIVLLGQAAETSAAQALAVLKVKALGLSVETDAALVIDIEPLRRLVGQVTETDVAQVVTTIIAGRAKIILLEDVVLNHGAMESVAANLADLQDVTMDI